MSQEIIYRPRIWSSNDNDVMDSFSIHTDIPCTSIFAISTRKLEEIPAHHLDYASSVFCLEYKPDMAIPEIAGMVDELKEKMVREVRLSQAWLESLGLVA